MTSEAALSAGETTADTARAGTRGKTTRGQTTRGKTRRARREDWLLRGRWLLDGVRATLPAWIAARVLVGGLSWYLDPAHPLGKLFMWDTKWYLVIAKQGYDHAGILIHFFPATSLGAAGLADVTRLPTSIALFAFCWAFALLFGALVHRVVVRETGDHAAARRAAWLTQLAPGAFALVMGYTEPLAGVLAVGYFLAVRGGSGGRRWDDGRVSGSIPDSADGVDNVDGADSSSSSDSRTSRNGLTTARMSTAIALGFLSGMARPIGVLLAIPGAIEGLRHARDGILTRSATTIAESTTTSATTKAKSAAKTAAVAKGAAIALAPAAGLATFLAYSRARYGSWMLPYTQQTGDKGRGAIMGDPIGILRRVWSHDPRHHGHEVAIMAAILILCFAALLPVVARRLPISYLAWTVPSFFLAIGSKYFTSLPRYLGALFPCLIAAALITQRRWQWVAVLATSCVMLLWTTYLAFKSYTVA